MTSSRGQEPLALKAYGHGVFNSWYPTCAKYDLGSSVVWAWQLCCQWSLALKVTYSHIFSPVWVSIAKKSGHGPWRTLQFQRRTKAMARKCNFWQAHVQTLQWLCVLAWVVSHSLCASTKLCPGQCMQALQPKEYKPQWAWGLSVHILDSDVQSLSSTTAETVNTTGMLVSFAATAALSWTVMKENKKFKKHETKQQILKLLDLIQSYLMNCKQINQFIM